MRVRRVFTAAVTCAVLIGVALIGCGQVEAVTAVPAPADPLAADFFAGPDNPWNQPVPPGAPADPNSARYIAALRDDRQPVVSVSQFAVPIFRADADTPRYRIEPTASWAGPELALDGVPIPDGAAPDPADDGHLTVIDDSTGCVYDFYRARPTPEGWTAEWVNATPTDGSGVYPDGLAARASGFSSAAGLIWPEELAAGRIDHALFFAYPLTRKNDLVGQATRTDGRSSDPAALPLGARLVLDPALDLTTLGLDPVRLTIARALQEYGMILADSSHGFTLWAVHPASYPADPYLNTFGPVEYFGLGSIPFNRMKVLPLGDVRGRYTGPPIRNRCTAPER